MAPITNGLPPSQPLPAVAPSSRSGSSLRLTAFAYYIQNHPELFGLLQYDKIETTKDICALVNGERPTDVQLLGALQLAVARVNTAVADLLSRNESISALTIQKIDEVEANQTHATGVLYQDLRNAGLIRGEPLSSVEDQRAAIAVVDVTHVTGLNLIGKKLKCVPKEIARFTALQFLGLQHNQISHLLPGVFDSLRALRSLGLGHNQISYLAPGVFDNLRTLRSLELSHNQLSDLPPKVFDSLATLKRLCLTGNQLTYLLAKVFDNLTALKWLYLNRNGLTSLPATIFDSLTALIELRLQGNPLEERPLLPSRVEVHY